MKKFLFLMPLIIALALSGCGGQEDEGTLNAAPPSTSNAVKPPMSESKKEGMKAPIGRPSLGSDQ